MLEWRIARLNFQLAPVSHSSERERRPHDKNADATEESDVAITELDRVFPGRESNENAVFEIGGYPVGAGGTNRRLTVTLQHSGLRELYRDGLFRAFVILS